MFCAVNVEYGSSFDMLIFNVDKILIFFRIRSISIYIWFSFFIADNHVRKETMGEEQRFRYENTNRWLTGTAATAWRSRANVEGLHMVDTG